MVVEAPIELTSGRLPDPTAGAGEVLLRALFRGHQILACGAARVGLATFVRWQALVILANRNSILVGRNRTVLYITVVTMSVVGPVHVDRLDVPFLSLATLTPLTVNGTSDLQVPGAAMVRVK
jgi:hypothetical protein